jgi:hypothetical protein
MKKIFLIVCNLLMIGMLYANPLFKIQNEGEWIKEEETADKVVWCKNDVIMTKVNHLKDCYVELKDDDAKIIFECNKNNIQNVTSDLLNGVIPNIKYEIVKLDSKPKLKKRTISKANKEDTANGKREGVSTASSRASEAKEDFIWDE